MVFRIENVLEIIIVLILLNFLIVLRLVNKNKPRKEIVLKAVLISIWYLVMLYLNHFHPQLMRSYTIPFTLISLFTVYIVYDFIKFRFY